MIEGFGPESYLAGHDAEQKTRMLLPEDAKKMLRKYFHDVYTGLRLSKNKIARELDISGEDVNALFLQKGGHGRAFQNLSEVALHVSNLLSRDDSVCCSFSGPRGTWEFDLLHALPKKIRDTILDALSIQLIEEIAKHMSTHQDAGEDREDESSEIDAVLRFIGNPEGWSPEEKALMYRVINQVRENYGSNMKSLIRRTLVCVLDEK